MGEKPYWNFRQREGRSTRQRSHHIRTHNRRKMAPGTGIILEMDTEKLLHSTLAKTMGR